MAGRRPMNQPTAGPTAAEHSTPTISSALAAPELKPAPSTRYGRPHSTPNAVAVDIEAKCTQKPSRVAGSAHDATHPPGHGAQAVPDLGRVAQPAAARRPGRPAAPTPRPRRPATARRRPAKLVVQPSRSSACDERQGGEHVADHPDQRGERDQGRVTARAEPRRDEAQHADEGHRVAAAEQRAGDQRRRVGRREREQQLAEAHQHRRRRRAAGAGRTDRPARRSGSASPRRRRSAA